MPVQHHPVFVSRQIERQASHRVGMMHMYDVILLADASQLGYHPRSYHRGSQFAPGIHADEFAAAVDARDAGQSHASAQHVAVHASCRQTSHEVHHHLLYSTAYRIEFTQL